MSAWYVFSALGFYPVNPAGGQYVFGSPMIDEAEISLPGNKTFIIKTINQSAENIYVKKITLNGKPYNLDYLDHMDILKGGELVFEMGKKE